MLMRPQLVSTLALALFIAACSSTTPTKPAAKATASPAATATPSGTSASASKTASATAAVNPDYLKRGYRPVKSKGEVLYCRSESITGTKFKSSVCLTENQLKEQEENMREAAREMDRQRAPGCVSPPCS